MTTTTPDEEAIFHRARAIVAPDDRAEFLGRACRGDGALRARVEGLIGVVEGEPDFLAPPPPISLQPTVACPPHEGGLEGAIGPYRLREAIGEGGMGTVFLAEQVEPVRRRVALKVIKPGMDSKQVVARFEAERQALAMMDHPNIARVHDGGVTPAGRPYFVMELVRGLPITEYCDQQQLSIAGRLELFVLVCRAVQHAHQKGVIHRDLKPSNVLVTDIDGVGVPKVIDFGVAKATGQALTDKTLFTGFHQFVGTPLYVSPEQANLSGTDVDTRSDIYSLGVLLYELLTGTTPFDSETLKRAAFDEMRRIIREEEPPKPSTRLSTLGKELSTVSARRKADARRLESSVKGELDWVVMKALEKDRRLRYQTASDFAADIMRYLTALPIEAGPPSRRYRFAKYARRHRALLTTAALVLLALVSGLAAASWQALRATAAERRTGAALLQAEQNLDLVRQAVDDLYGAVAGSHEDDSLGPVPRPFLEKALPLYQRFAALPRTDLSAARAHQRVGEILQGLGRRTEAARALGDAIAVYKALRVVEPDDPEHIYELALSHALRAHALREQPARNEREKALALLDGLHRRFPADGRYAWHLGAALLAKGGDLWKHAEYAAAIPVLEAALANRERLHAAHPNNPAYRDALGAAYRELGTAQNGAHRREESTDSFRKARDITENLVRRYPLRPRYRLHLGWTYAGLGNLLLLTGRYDEAEQVFTRGIQVCDDLITATPEEVGYRDGRIGGLGGRSIALYLHGRRDEAERIHDELRRTISTRQYAGYCHELAWFIGFSRKAELWPSGVELAKRALTIQSDSSRYWATLGGLQLDLKDYSPAIASLTRSLELDPDTDFGYKALTLAMAHHHSDHPQEARKWYDRAVAWVDEKKLTEPILRKMRAHTERLLDGTDLGHSSSSPQGRQSGPPRPESQAKQAADGRIRSWARPSDAAWTPSPSPPGGGDAAPPHRAAAGSASVRWHLVGRLDVA